MLKRAAALQAIVLLGACGNQPPPPAQVTSKLAAYDSTGCLGPGCSGGLTDGEFEYVIVGAGAGGGPLAARLAQQGHKVLLLEAGGDPGDRLTYQIPAWHALASEDPTMRWDYFVNHYDDATQAARDDKLVRDANGNPKGVFYPRGSGVGGSTALNALIAVTPHASDWDGIADLVADEDPLGTWRSTQMGKYFERAENNHYLPMGTAGHGFSGWMHSEEFLGKFFDYLMGATDLKMLRVMAASIFQTAHELGNDLPFDPIRDIAGLLAYMNQDINSPDPGRDGREGAFRLPQQSLNGVRRGVREFILDTISAGNPLTLKTHALATNIIFDRSGAKPKAIGVEWIDGANLYQASPLTDPKATGVARSIKVTGEVIVSAGAFNTPQLLMLSGVGPRADLERQGIQSVVDLPGVGANLQDRYEVGVIGEMSSMFGNQFRIIKDCSFNANGSPETLTLTDPCYLLWKLNAGVYTINGSVIGIVKRSDPKLKDPDLFLFGIPGYFRGYFPGYSPEVTAKKTYFTWAIIKAHTKNNVGSVTLKSADPRERPDVHFRYFGDPGTADADLQALVEGVLFARRIVGKTQQLSPFTDKFNEVYPGTDLQTRDQIAQFIRDKAWGHHACCTAKIGNQNDPMAVLDSRFRVRGTDGLRVVDASAFPRIPGFFISVPIYMISEKAADVILEDAQSK
jgi:choline dehydrogenase